MPWSIKPSADIAAYQAFHSFYPGHSDGAHLIGPENLWPKSKLKAPDLEFPRQTWVFNGLETLWQDCVYLLPTITVSQWQRIPPPKTPYCCCRVGMCSLSMMQLFGDVLPLVSDTLLLLAALNVILAHLISFTRCFTRELVAFELRMKQIISSIKAFTGGRILPSGSSVPSAVFSPSSDHSNGHYKKQWGYCASHWFSNVKRLPNCDIILGGEANVELDVISHYCVTDSLWYMENIHGFLHQPVWYHSICVDGAQQHHMLIHLFLSGLFICTPGHGGMFQASWEFRNFSTLN